MTKEEWKKAAENWVLKEYNDYRSDLIGAFLAGAQAAAKRCNETRTLRDLNLCVEDMATALESLT